MRPECRTDQKSKIPPFWKTGADRPSGRKGPLNRKIRGRCGQNTAPTKIPLSGKRGPVDPWVRGGPKSKNKGTDSARMPHRPKSKIPLFGKRGPIDPIWCKEAINRKIRGRCGQNAAPTKIQNAPFLENGGMSIGPPLSRKGILVGAAFWSHRVPYIPI